MMLDENKTYRTRDGSRTGIRVHHRNHHSKWPWQEVGASLTWSDTGHVGTLSDHPFDLIEEQPAARPFSYEACPMHEDGRRRAVTEGGKEVVLLCHNAPGRWPIVGSFLFMDKIGRWASDGRSASDVAYNLLIPTPPKRIAWFNLWPNGCWTRWDTQMQADCQETNYPVNTRLGNRAYPIEVDA